MKKIALLPIPCIVFELKLSFGKYNNDTPIVEKPETAEEIMLRFVRIQKKKDLLRNPLRQNDRLKLNKSEFS